MSRAPLLSLTALRVLAVTALSFSLLAACGKADEAAENTATEAVAEAAIEAMTDAEFDIEDGGQTVSGVDEQGRAFSASQGSAAKIPADFPSDVVVPEGLALDTSMVVGTNVFIGGTLPGELATLTAGIDAAMKEAGWTSVMAMTSPESGTLLWKREDRSVSYTIEAQPEGQLGLAISYGIDEAPAPAGTTP